MRLENMPSEFQEALPVLKKIKNAGFDAYFVGGSVRDALLERPIHDVDIASSSYTEETKRDNFSDRGSLCGLSQT